jgi:hypothetical protein
MLRLETFILLLGTIPIAAVTDWVVVLIAVATTLVFSALTVRLFDHVRANALVDLQRPSLDLRHHARVAISGYLTMLVPALQSLTIAMGYAILAGPVPFYAYVWLYTLATAVPRTIEANNGPPLLRLTNAIRLFVGVACLLAALAAPIWLLAALPPAAVAVILLRQALLWRKLVNSMSNASVGSRQEDPRPLLTIFQAPTAEGVEFAGRIRSEATGMDYRVELVERATQEAVFGACVFGDAVLFDATFGEGAPDKMDSAMYMLKSGYAVTASRRELPLSFPSFDPISPPRQRRLSTDEMVAQVRERLTELRQLLPRPSAYRGVENADAIMETGLDVMFRRRRRDIFISYRGHAELDVDHLAAKVSGATSGARSVRFLRGGELALSNEALSGVRRWEVLHAINRWMRSAEEIWLYRTPDYLDSWWTRAEIVLIAAQPDELGDRVRVYDPANDRLDHIDIDALPSLSKAQFERIQELLLLGMNAEYAYRIDSTNTKRALREVRTAGELLRRSFREDLLLQCATPPPSPPGYRFDIDDFLMNRQPALHSIPKDDVFGAMSADRPVSCPECGRTYRLTLDAPRFRWYPKRDGVGTGPSGRCLEELPTVVAKAMT